jgi:hypothetical protein
MNFLDETNDSNYRHLIEAIIVQAIRDGEKHKVTEKKMDALRFLESEGCSFYCKVIGIDCDAVKKWSMTLYNNLKIGDTKMTDNTLITEKIMDQLVNKAISNAYTDSIKEYWRDDQVKIGQDNKIISVEHEGV